MRNKYIVVGNQSHEVFDSERDARERAMEIIGISDTIRWVHVAKVLVAYERSFKVTEVEESLRQTMNP